MSLLPTTHSGGTILSLHLYSSLILEHAWISPLFSFWVKATITRTLMDYSSEDKNLTFLWKKAS